MTNLDFDIVIAGAGPAGCSTALSLADSGLKIALIDKAVFPREKVCGDGITIDSINQLYKLSPRLAKTIHSFEQKSQAKGVLITSTKGYSSYFEISENKRPYIFERALFDYELLKECKNYKNIHVFENTRINTCIISEEQAQIKTSSGNFTGKMVVGADGVNSLIAKVINPNKVDETMYGMSVRAYLSNVKDMGYENVIEVYYLKELVPGYFWIFHMHDNIRNVGLGMDEKTVKKYGVKLGEVFKNIINNDPRFKERFKDAVWEDELKAYRVPVFNRYRKIYSNRILLTGDAANMVNPLSGEGIGNALRTGRFAAEHLEKCFAANNFSKEFNKAYYKRVRRTMFPQLNRHSLIALLNTSQWLSNYALKNNSLPNKLIRAFV